MNPTTTPDGRVSDVWTAEDTSAEPPNVNEEATVEDLEGEAVTILTGAYRIDESQTALAISQQIAASLLNGIPVGVGAFVDTAVQEWTAGSAPLNAVNLNDPQGGGHWICLDGFSIVDDVYVFDIANSWGTSYGDAGHFSVTGAWIAAAASDLYPWAISQVASRA